MSGLAITKLGSAAGLILAIIAAFLSNEMMFYSSILFSAIYNAAGLIIEEFK